MQSALCIDEFGGNFLNEGNIDMAGVKETRVSFEILEAKRPLAGDVTMSRGDLLLQKSCLSTMLSLAHHQ